MEIKYKMKFSCETKREIGLAIVLGGSFVWLCVIFGIIMPLSMPWWFMPEWWQTLLVCSVSIIPFCAILAGGLELYIRNSM